MRGGAQCDWQAAQAGCGQIGVIILAGCPRLQQSGPGSAGCSWWGILGQPSDHGLGGHVGIATLDLQALHPAASVSGQNYIASSWCKTGTDLHSLHPWQRACWPRAPAGMLANRSDHAVVCTDAPGAHVHSASRRCKRQDWVDRVLTEPCTRLCSSPLNQLRAPHPQGRNHTYAGIPREA